MHKLVDIVIVSLYRAEKTINCIKSLYQNCDKELFNIVLIDNGSDYETCKQLENMVKENSDISFVLNVGNRYIGGARKQALRYCPGEYVLYLDNDMEVEKGFVGELVNAMIKKVAVVGGKVIKDGKIQLHGREIKENSDGVKILDYSADNCDVDDERASQYKYVDMIHGGATLFRRSVLEEIEFDPFYTIGFEDMDMMMRIKEKGHKIAYCPDAVAHHYPDFYGEYGKIRRNVELIGKCKKYFQDKWRIKT